MQELSKLWIQRGIVYLIAPVSNPFHHAFDVSFDLFFICPKFEARPMNWGRMERGEQSLAVP